MYAAVENGADSVYIGLKEFSARAFAVNFSIQDVPSILSFLKKRGKKLYIAVNTIIKEGELPLLLKYLAFLEKIGIDAVIFQDFGIIEAVQRFFPNLKLHASTQTTNLNTLDTQFFNKFNIKRVVLDRQLRYEEIKSIVERTDIETEIFIHGAVCYSFSGQCLFSSFLGGQSANRGRCTQPCRRSYFLSGHDIGNYFSPHDLCSISNIEKLLELNVTSFKIEGRMKNATYVGNVTKAYRILIDQFYKDKFIDQKLKDEAEELIKKSFGRRYSNGFYFYSDNIVEPKLSGGNGLFVGKVLESSSDFLKLKLNIDINEGDVLRIQELRESVRVKDIILKDKVTHNGRKNSTVLIPIGKSLKVRKGNNIFKISEKESNSEYKFPLPKTKNFLLSDFPTPDFADSGSNKQEIYFKLKTIEDINVFRDNTRDYLIFPITDLEKPLRVNKKKLTTLKDNIIFEIPPFIFNSETERFYKLIKSAKESGFNKFYLNSKGQINLFDGSKDNFLIASERFHLSNDLSISFLAKLGFKRWVIDIENEKDNLDKIILKGRSIITVYANYPLLISRIPNKLKNNAMLTDDKKHNFFIKSKGELTTIFDERNFNLLSVRRDIEKSGYSKFLFDVSNVKYYNSGLIPLYESLKNGKISSGTDFNYSMGWM